MLLVLPACKNAAQTQPEEEKLLMLEFGCSVYEFSNAFSGCNRQDFRSNYGICKRKYFGKRYDFI